MMIEVVLSIVFPVCFIVILIGCLDCLFKKKRLETFRSRDATDGGHGTAFSVDICDIPSSSSEQVTIEPLPDILSKVSAPLILRPQMTVAERGKHEATLPVASVQQSFPRDHLTYLNEIGSGWFGKVIETEAVQIVDGSYKSYVVVKMLKDDASKSEQMQFLDEVNAFRCLEDANLMSLLGQCTETAPFLVILEFAAYGSLKNYLIQNRQDVDEIASNRLISFALDAASGLACLHRHNYIHNDLAARNCLIMSNYTLKIGDYGNSDHLFKNEYYNTGTFLLPIRWMAPEILTNVDGVWTARSYGKSSDMWSFGILLWEISSLGERPYDTLTDEAVLQQVILNRQVLPSAGDLKLPLKDRMWPIMVQCWQDPLKRLDIEQAYGSLEQMTRIRIDTMDVMSDFDQKWNQLKQNQARTSSSGADLGSRIALAGSFVTDGSSSPSDKPSALDEDSESTDGTKSDDIIIDVGVDGIYGSRSYNNQSVPTISVHATDNDPSLNMFPKDDIINNSHDYVTVENEFTRTSASPSYAKSPESPSHVISPKSPIQPEVITSTLVFQGQISTSHNLPSDSPLGSKYTTANETFFASSHQEEEFKNLSNMDNTFSLDSEANTFQELLDSASQNPVINSNDVSNYNLPLQTEDEDFSEFVRTSPTAPSVDFTDFASAENNVSAKAELVNEKTKIDNNTSVVKSGRDSSTDVDVADNSFSEFAGAADDKSNSDNDMNSFSDFVTSAPTSNADSRFFAGNFNSNASDDTNGGVAQSSAGDDMPSSFGSGPLSSDMFSLIEAMTNFEHETESSSTGVNISEDKISTVKAVPDQNQNIFSTEEISSDMLISDASFLSDDFHFGISSEAPPSQSKHLKTSAEINKEINSLESFHTQTPAVTDVLSEGNTDIHDLDKSISSLGSVNFLEQRLQSDSAQSADSSTPGDERI